jgi:phosphatidate phosphatase APP1
MTSRIRGGFRRLLIIGAALPAVAALGVGLTAASASASTTAPAYGHQRCDDTLTYIQEGYYGGHFVLVRDVCPGVEVIRTRHHGENVFYQTERRGFLRDHFATDVRDVHVF